MGKDSEYNYRRLKTNIGAVRKASGDTQEESGHYLGRSSSLLGNIEGERHNPPTLETIRRFAQRYRFTIDELLYDDFSSMMSIEPILEHSEKCQKAVIYLLPIVSSTEALKNELFKKGYELQKKVYLDIKNGIELSDDCGGFIGYYCDAFERDYIPEAAANLIGWFILYAFAELNPEFFNAVEEKGLSNAFKEHYLVKFDFNEEPESIKSDTRADRIEGEKLRKEVLAEIEPEILELLECLKKDSQWSDIADYYIAIQYIFNVVNNNKSAGFNDAFGRELLDMYAKIGNKYAKRLLQGLKKIYT